MLPQRSKNLAVTTCIAIIKAMENQDLKISTTDLLNNVRYCSYLDSIYFQVMFSTSGGRNIVPGGALTQIDIDSFKLTMKHILVEDFIEDGVSVDPNNPRRVLAFGHVLAGISAGAFIDNKPLSGQVLTHYVKTGLSAKLGPLKIESDKVTFDSPVNFGFIPQLIGLDPVYASTITGDIGQTITGNNKLWTDTNYPSNIGGIGSEATSAELYGDIDGFLIGAWIRSPNNKQIRDRMRLPMNNKNNVRLSTILGEYYGIIPSQSQTLKMQTVFGTPLLGSLRFSTFIKMLGFKRFRLELLYQTVVFHGRYSAITGAKENTKAAVEAYRIFENWCCQEFTTLINAGKLSKEWGVPYSTCIYDPESPTWLEVTPSFIAKLNDTDQIDAEVDVEIYDLATRNWFNSELFIDEKIVYQNIYDSSLA